MAHSCVAEFCVNCSQCFYDVVPRRFRKFISCIASFIAFVAEEAKYGERKNCRWTPVHVGPKQTLWKASLDRSISFFDCFMFLSFLLSLIEMKWKFWRLKAIWEYSKVSFSVCLWHLDGKTTKLELSWDSDRIYMPAFVRMRKFGKTYYNKMHIWR